jgi:hypothetical protein
MGMFLVNNLPSTTNGNIIFVLSVMNGLSDVLGIETAASSALTTKYETSTISVGPITTSGTNRLIVGCVQSIHDYVNPVTSISDTNGLTWNLAIRNLAVDGANPQAEIWWATSSLPVTNLSVTATFSGTHWQPRFTIVALTGANLVSPIGATGSGAGSTYNTGTATSGVLVGPIQFSGSIVFGSLGKYDQTLGFASGTTRLTNIDNNWGQTVYSALKTTASGGDVFVGFSGIPTYGRYCAVEIKQA